MNQHHSNPAHKISLTAGSTVATSGFMAALMLGLFAPSALAQSAANFEPKKPKATAPTADQVKDKPKSSATKKEIAKPADAADNSLINTPSRMVNPAGLEAYLASVSSMFLSRGRTLDPFGMPQDPDAKPVPKAPVPGAIKRIAPIQATPFPDIINKIVVTTIMPRERRFLLGTRSVKQGEQIPINFRGKLFRVEVTEVNSRQISFKNLESGEVATRKLDMMPAGMSAGSRGITAPGMTLDRQNAPIELETGESSP